MRHPIYKVLSFKKQGPYTLKVFFNDKTNRLIDFSSVLAGELYGPLQDPKMFDRVRVDSEIQTLVWPNGADFDPAILHDWPKHVRAFSTAARRWKPAAKFHFPQLRAA